MSTSVPPPGFVPEPAPRAPDPLPAPEPSRSLGGRWKLAAAGAAVLAVAAAAFLLVGSGGGSLSGPIAQAATVSSSTEGFRMHMTLDMSSPSLGAPITATGSGVVDLRDQASSMSMDMNFGDDPQVTQALGGGSLHMDMLLAGTDVFVKLPSAAVAALPLGGKQWVKLDLAKIAGIPGLSSLTTNPTASDPRQVLAYLRAASDGVVDEGPQRVDGFQTTHYRAFVSFDRLLSALPSADQKGVSQLEQMLPSGELPVDVWIDAAHLVRRVAMSLNLTPPSGASLQEAMTIDLGDYGPQARPTPPPSDQVQDLTGLASAG
jgi:hypothetical protein